MSLDIIFANPADGSLELKCYSVNFISQYISLSAWITLFITFSL